MDVDHQRELFFISTGPQEHRWFFWVQLSSGNKVYRIGCPVMCVSNTHPITSSWFQKELDQKGWKAWKVPYVVFFSTIFFGCKTFPQLFTKEMDVQKRSVLWQLDLGCRFWGSRLEHLRIQRDDSATATATVDAMYNWMSSWIFSKFSDMYQIFSDVCRSF